ncbi:Tetraspanin-5, partial [Durusdinium trenchii]
PFAVYAGFVFGGAIILLAGLGYFGAVRQRKKLLITYWLLMVACTLVVLSVGLIVVLYLGYLDGISTGSAAIDSAAAAVNDVQMAVYATCCNVTVASIALCTDKLGGCVVDVGRVEDFEVPDALCNLLEVTESEQEGVNIVSFEGCQFPTAFAEQFQEFLSANIEFLGAVFLPLALLLTLATIATMVLICSNRYDYDPYYRAKIDQRNAEIAAAEAADPDGAPKLV